MSEAITEPVWRDKIVSRAQFRMPLKERLAACWALLLTGRLESHHEIGTEDVLKGAVKTKTAKVAFHGPLDLRRAKRLLQSGAKEEAEQEADRAGA